MFNDGLMDGWILDILDIINLEQLRHFFLRVYQLLGYHSLALHSCCFSLRFSSGLYQTSWNSNTDLSVYPIPFEKQPLHSRNKSKLQVTAEFWKVMGFYIRAVHCRNPGKHCVNLLFSPDAECRAFILNEEQGAGGGWMNGWVCGWRRKM